MTRADVVIQSMEALKENYEQAKADGALKEEAWWEDEFGRDLTDMIDCHVVYQGDPPCLMDERGLSRYLPPTATVQERCNNTVACDRACAECKAIFLMGEYE